MGSLLAFLFAAAFAGCVVWLVVCIPYRMAVRRNRSGGLWVIISLICSPVLAILLLLALGRNEVREAS